MHEPSEPTEAAAKAAQPSLQELLLAFMTHLPGGAWIKDRQGRYVFANAKVAHTAGCSAANVLSKTDDEIWDSASAAQFTRNDEQVWATGQPLQQVETAVGQGRRASLLVTKFPMLDGTGRPWLLGGVGVSVSTLERAEQALAQSEERYRRLVEASPDLIGVSVGGRVSFINAAGAAMLGASCPEELLGTEVIKFVHPSFRQKAAENIRQLFRPGEPVRVVRETWMRRDGHPIEVELNAFPFHYEGQPAIYIVAQDVSDRVRAEAKLRAYAQQLQSLSQSLVEAQESERRHLARELHDQVGQALTAIQLNLQAVLRQSAAAAPDPRLAESLQMIHGLVQQTQDLSLSLRPLMLDDLGLEATLHWYTRMLATRADLRIELSAAPFAGRLEPAIETACFRIAQEALTNVVRHARAHEVTVQLQTDEDQLHLVVYDDGMGFDVAARLGPTASTPSPGLLGMQERALSAGGRFDCQSDPASGTQVHAWFPLRWRAPGPDAPSSMP